MSRQNLLILVIELLWLAAVAIAAFICIIPFRGTLSSEFIFVNLGLALIFFFYFRVLIFYRSLIFLRPLAIKILLFLFNIFLFIKIADKLQEMIYLLDVYDLSFFLVPQPRISGERLITVFSFFKGEYLFFSIGALVLLCLIQLRLLFSFFENIRKIK